MTLEYAAVIADLEEKRSSLDAVIVLLRDLYGSPAPPAAKADAPRKYQKRLKVAAPKEDEGSRPSPVQDALLDVLKVGPMTSIQAFEALKKAGSTTSVGSVYSTLHILFKKGLIHKTQNDEGRNAWKLGK